MKWLKRIVIAVVALFIVALGIIYFSLNSIIRSAVESQSSASLNVPTSLSSASLALFGGKVSLSDFEVSSPPKFTAPKLLTLKGLSVSVSYGQLRDTPIHIKQIVIDSPKLVVERNGGGFNIQAMMDQMPKTPAGGGEPMKLIIDEMQLSNAVVDIQPGVEFPGLPKDIEVPIPSLVIKNIGNADGSQNGAAIKDVVMQVVTALAAEASKDGKVPLDFNKMLQTNLAGVSQKLGGEFNKQVEGITGNITKGLPTPVGDMIKGATTQQTDTLLKNLPNFGGEKKK